MILRVLRRTFQTTQGEDGEFYYALILLHNIDCQPARCKIGKARNSNCYLIGRHSIHRISGLLYSDYRELRNFIVALVPGKSLHSSFVLAEPQSSYVAPIKAFLGNLV